ncbi:unnamed protein product [Plutella xylostella]|uniref:(diamondback moth) hypothetical protein n=1 Tax=Plutella xylostella TaxID=51655 RepID=A0A8S4EMP2_PLUXY|nr:unnamed protein product [Plutella xylostella]
MSQPDKLPTNMEKSESLHQTGSTTRKSDFMIFPNSVKEWMHGEQARKMYYCVDDLCSVIAPILIMGAIIGLVVGIPILFSRVADITPYAPTTTKPTPATGKVTIKTAPSNMTNDQAIEKFVDTLDLFKSWMQRYKSEVN